MNWSYISGFFDGEGSITHNGKGFRLTISQTNRGVLSKIQRFSQAGYVIEVKKRKPHWKRGWVFYIATQEDILNFLKNSYPFLIVKKDLAKKTIPILEVRVKQKRERELASKKLKAQARRLRKKGLTYRQIGKKLKIDFGHARRIILK